MFAGGKVFGAPADGARHPRADVGVLEILANEPVAAVERL